MPRRPPTNNTDAAAAPENSPEALPLLPLEPDAFRKRLGAWYRRHARELPWRGVNDPYATWLSEIMLQQTRVTTVMERYVEFLARFPTIAALAAADEADVLALWSGLGYYRRARMLHRGAQFVARELGGALPGSAAELRTLPGVGEYTSAAIASIAFGESIAVVDGNVERVLLRVLGLAEERTAAARARVNATAQSLAPPALKRRSRSGANATNPPGDHNQAMMELGATICLPRAPLCLQCPVVELCRTRGEHATAPREPQRSRTVAHLLTLRKHGVITEVLLERRAADASLMAGMLELPPLPLEAVAGREPVLRLRHSITNTNFYVQVFTEGAPGAQLVARDGGAGPDMEAPGLPLLDVTEEELGGPHDLESNDEAVFVPSTPHVRREPSLLAEVPAAAADLIWQPTAALRHLPLTGLARKTLQRLGVMAVPKVSVAAQTP